METFGVKTSARVMLVNITSQVEEIVAASGVSEGICVVYTPHTTAAITINEAADPDVARDIAMMLGKTIPRDPGFRHAEGNSDAHVKSSLVGASEHIIITGGRLNLGTWQGIFFSEFDGPRSRKVHVKVIGD